MFFVAIELRPDVGEGIAEQPRRLLQRVDRVLDLLRVVPVALVLGQQLVERLGLDVADVGFDLEVAELVALALLDDVGDDEILAVGRQLGDRRDDAEVGIALRQVELPQLLLVVCQPVGIVGVTFDVKMRHGRACRVAIAFLRTPSLNFVLPRMLIWRTFDFAPSLIS